MRLVRPSEQAMWVEIERSMHPDHYISEDPADPSCRDGPLGAENEMPEGGDSTRGMSNGPASKSPLPTCRKPQEEAAGLCLPESAEVGLPQAVEARPEIMDDRE